MGDLCPNEAETGCQAKLCRADKMALDIYFGQLKPTLQVSQNFALKK